MNGRGLKLYNEYAVVLGRMYDETPKAVFAALAVSLSNQLEGETLDGATLQCRLAAEWEILHQNGIVPQKPKTYPIG